LLDEGAANISLIYSDLETFFLLVFARDLAGVFALTGTLAFLGAGADTTFAFSLALLIALHEFLLIYSSLSYVIEDVVAVKAYNKLTSSISSTTNTAGSTGMN
jgi:hypothetical protein